MYTFEAHKYALEVSKSSCDLPQQSMYSKVKIIKNCSRRLIGLSQECYIKKALELFRIHHSKPIDTLVEKNYTVITVILFFGNWNKVDFFHKLFLVVFFVGIILVRRPSRCQARRTESGSAIG